MRASATKSEPSPLDKIRTRVTERERIGLTSATPERVLKAGEEGTEYTHSNVQRLHTGPLDKLWKNGELMHREFHAGDQFRLDHFRSRMDPGAPTVDWGAIGGNFGPRNPSMFGGQEVADARLRWRKVQDTLGPKPRKRAGLVWTVLTNAILSENSAEELGAKIFGRGDRREARAAGHAGFQVALSALADFYGM